MTKVAWLEKVGNNWILDIRTSKSITLSSEKFNCQ